MCTQSHFHGYMATPTHDLHIYTPASNAISSCLCCSLLVTDCAACRPTVAAHSRRACKRQAGPEACPAAVQQVEAQPADGSEKGLCVEHAVVDAGWTGDEDQHSRGNHPVIRQQVLAQPAGHMQQLQEQEQLKEPDTWAVCCVDAVGAHCCETGCCHHMDV